MQEEEQLITFHQTEFSNAADSQSILWAGRIFVMSYVRNFHDLAYTALAVLEIIAGFQLGTTNFDHMKLDNISFALAFWT